MGQGDIIDLLKKEKKWLTTKQIAKKLKVGYSCTLVKLRKLRKSKDLVWRKVGHNYLYKKGKIKSKNGQEK